MTNKDTELYFIALLPTQEVANTIRELKWEAKEKFGTQQAMKSPPHLTLHMPFKLKIGRETELLDFLYQFSVPHKPISVIANGVASFPPAVLYVDVLKNPDLDLIQQQLLASMRANFQLFNGLYKDKAFHPHFTFAFRDLKKSKYPAAWEHFKDRPISAEMLIEELTLLKHNGKSWDVYQQFPMLGHTNVSEHREHNS
jgi:2'-5' RNA ligase